MFFEKKAKTTYIARTYGDPVLRQKAEAIGEVTPEIRQLADYMVAAVSIFNGVGLAAPQVGVSKQMVVLDVPFPEQEGMLSPGETLLLPQMPLVIINPEIVGFDKELLEYDEGCISVPDLYAPVVRPALVTVRATLLNGEQIECECGGLLGRCLQHELDHLAGKLFVDLLSEADAKKVAKQLAGIKKYGEKHNYERKASK